MSFAPSRTKVHDFKEAFQIDGWGAAHGLSFFLGKVASPNQTGVNGGFIERADEEEPP